MRSSRRDQSLPAPLRDRFRIKYQVDYYTDDEILTILQRSFKMVWELDGEEYEDYLRGLLATDVEVVTDPDTGEETTVETDQPTLAALKMLAHRAKGVPRMANQLLISARDYAIGYLDDDQELWEAPLTPEIVSEAMIAQGIDKHGLSTMDRKIMTTLFTRYKQRVGVSVKSIAAAVGETAATIETVYEPNLVRLGFLDRGERGRQLTTQGQLLATLELEGLTEY